LRRKNEKFPIAFIIIFFAFGFLMKLLSEFFHEIGHGILVIIFGGRVSEIYISPFWPFQHSWIKWNLPANIGNFELSLVYAGGILLCLIISFGLQFFLTLRKCRWIVSLPFAWLSFWCFLNGTGYLILGGLVPFGDVEKLIKLGSLTWFSSLAVGLALFVIGFFLLSKVFFDVFSRFFSIKASKFAVMLFWMQIPIYCVFILSL